MRLWSAVYLVHVCKPTHCLTWFDVLTSNKKLVTLLAMLPVKLFAEQSKLCSHIPSSTVAGNAPLKELLLASTVCMTATTSYRCSAILRKTAA